MISIAVCEDDELQLNILKSYINKWMFSNNISIDLHSFSSAEHFLFSYEDYNFDILFLDIQMGELSGIELSNIVRNKNKEIKIIFTTGLSNYVFHGYKVDAIDYLIKPILQEDISYCLDKCLKEISSQKKTNKFILINSKKETIRVDYSDINYCIMFSHYIDIVTKDSTITTKKKISDLEKDLPEDIFIRCHRSYIVNISNVKLIKKYEITLDNGIVIPISKSRYDSLNNLFIKHHQLI